MIARRQLSESNFSREAIVLSLYKIDWNSTHCLISQWYFVGNLLIGIPFTQSFLRLHSQRHAQTHVRPQNEALIPQTGYFQTHKNNSYRRQLNHLYIVRSSMLFSCPHKKQHGRIITQKCNLMFAQLQVLKVFLLPNRKFHQKQFLNALDCPEFQLVQPK